MRSLSFVFLMVSFLLCSTSFTFSETPPAAPPVEQKAPVPASAPDVSVQTTTVSPEKEPVQKPAAIEPVKTEAPAETLQKPAVAQEPVAATKAAEEEKEEEPVYIADPIYPWNKAMYYFNDKLYFWLLKPAAQGYSAVMPEDMRIAVGNFFYNVATPVRFAGCLLQLKIKDSANELIRLLYNSTAGILGFADAAKEDLNIPRKEEDLGQTLGSYGIGHGFYIVWPFLGPSSLRDTVGKVGDYFLDPVSYVNPTEASVGITAYDKVNTVSLHIGDYEDLKKSAIDPYVSIRDAYTQYRKKKVEE